MNTNQLQVLKNYMVNPTKENGKSLFFIQRGLLDKLTFNLNVLEDAQVSGVSTETIQDIILQIRQIKSDISFISEKIKSVKNPSK